MSSLYIAPSILASDWGRFADEIDAVTDAGADWIHIDVMDGHFVPPITFGPGVVAAAKKATQLPLDVHLMIENPGQQIDAFTQAGSDIITVHAEACKHLHRVIQDIQSRGIKAGVALNPATPLSAVHDVLDNIDLLLVMTVNPGWGGQKFIARSQQKIAEAAELIEQSGRSIHLEVDGGITSETAKIATGAGANVLVAGTAIFSTADYKDAIEKLK